MEVRTYTLQKHTLRRRVKNATERTHKEGGSCSCTSIKYFFSNFTICCRECHNNSEQSQESEDFLHPIRVDYKICTNVDCGALRLAT